MTLYKCKTKTLLISALAIMLVFFAVIAVGKMFTQTVNAAQTSLLGDVDQDGKVSVNDVTCIQRIVAAFPVDDRCSIAAADIDGSGEVGIKDATYLQMWLADIQTSYPINEQLAEPTEISTEMPTDDDGWGRTIFQP